VEETTTSLLAEGNGRDFEGVKLLSAVIGKRRVLYCPRTMTPSAMIKKRLVLKKDFLKQSISRPFSFTRFVFILFTHAPDV